MQGLRAVLNRNQFGILYSKRFFSDGFRLLTVGGALALSHDLPKSDRQDGLDGVSDVPSSLFLRLSLRHATGELLALCDDIAIFPLAIYHPQNGVWRHLISSACAPL